MEDRLCISEAETDDSGVGMLWLRDDCARSTNGGCLSFLR